MAATDIVKRAPKWAYYSAAGIGGGIILLRVWNGRAKPDETATADDVTAAGQGAAYSQAASPVGVVVPPVIIGGTGDDSTGFGSSLPNSGVQLLEDNMSFFRDGFNDMAGIGLKVLNQQQETVDTIAGQNQQLLSNGQSMSNALLAALMEAGGKPQSTTTTTVINNGVPAATGTNGSTTATQGNLDALRIQVLRTSGAWKHPSYPGSWQGTATYAAAVNSLIAAGGDMGTIVAWAKAHGWTPMSSAAVSAPSIGAAASSVAGAVSGMISGTTPNRPVLSDSLLKSVVESSGQFKGYPYNANKYNTYSAQQKSLMAKGYVLPGGSIYTWAAAHGYKRV